MKNLFLIVFFFTCFGAKSQNSFNLEVQVRYMLEESYIYYSHQNPEIADGIIIDESGISHRVYNSVQEIYNQIEAGEFRLIDNESRVFYVFSLEFEQIKRGRSTLFIDTKSGAYKLKSNQF
jgi:hypothetical protein